MGDKNAAQRERREGARERSDDPLLVRSYVVLSRAGNGHDDSTDRKYGEKSESRGGDESAEGAWGHDKSGERTGDCTECIEAPKNLVEREVFLAEPLDELEGTEKHRDHAAADVEKERGLMRFIGVHLFGEIDFRIEREIAANQNCGEHGSGEKKCLGDLAGELGHGRGNILVRFFFRPRSWAKGLPESVRPASVESYP